jgi:hypothetical protein
VAIGANTCDRFLTDVAAFGETDRSLHAGHFLGKRVFIDVHAVDRRARFDSQRVIGLESGRLGSVRDQRLPHGCGVLLLAEKVVAGQTERLTAADWTRCFGEILRRVLQISQIRQLVSKSAFQDFSGSCSGQMHLRPLVRSVRQLHLL